MMRLEKSRYRAVRRDHEIFDHVGRAVLLRLFDTRDLAVVADSSRFDRLDLECAVVDTRSAQSTGNCRLQPQLRLQSAHPRCLVWNACAAIDPVADAGVGELGL